jgi:peptidoglycan/LPS O-acetylase OafA/YrhL
MEYRKEIDGLRAVAVLPVILFHAGWARVGGGFVGVDVFFVISGYLITSLILSEKAAGTFTLKGFYERRARRILPALLLVLLACACVGWFFMLPNRLEELSKSLIAIPILAANILFGREANYFAEAAELNPLLHTWSLAVEEQFYLIFPLVIVLLWPLKRRWLIGTLAILIVGTISFHFAETRSVSRPEFAFYLLRARAWELFLGAFVAFAKPADRHGATSENSPVALKQAASLLGMAMIAYAVLAYDRGTRYPSVHTLLPTVGTALIILCATPATIVGRLLSLRWVVGLGLISYSAYLWHQPMFAFARILGLGSDRVIGALACLSIVLAYFTWRFIEQPFRDRRRFSRTTIAGGAVAMSAAIFCTGLAIHFNRGFPDRLTGEQREVLGYRNYQAHANELYRYGRCLLRTEQPVSELSAECDVPRGGGARKAVLWGDSFGAHLYPALRDVSSLAVAQYASVCPPLLGVGFDYGRDCAEVEAVVLARIRAAQPDLIVISANWHKHEKHLHRLGATLERLRQLAGTAELVVVGNVPQWQPTLPELLATARRTLRMDLRIETPLIKDLRSTDKIVQDATHSGRARFLSPLEVLCDAYQCLASAPFDGAVQPLAYDYGHLTKGGSSLLIERLGLAR